MVIKSLCSEFETSFILEKTLFFLKELVLFFQTGNFPEEIKKDWANRTGGGICISGEKQYDIQLWGTIGVVPPEKENRYIFYSREKGERLFDHLQEGHLTSHESANPEKKEFGGAIFAEGKIYSFSALPEVRDKGDSILMLSLAVSLNRLNLERAIQISVEILKTENFYLFCNFLNEKKPGVFS